MFLSFAQQYFYVLNNQKSLNFLFETVATVITLVTSAEMVYYLTSAKADR